MKKLSALLMVIVLVFGTVGCGEKELIKTSAGLPSKINELGNEYDCIDDMPDWTGDKLDLTVWYGYGSNEVYIGKKAKDDKFRDELERVTGVRLSVEKSFDNGGQTGDAKLAKMVATDSWPDIGIGIEQSIVDSLVEAKKLHKISDLVPEYMSNYNAIINSSDVIKKQYDGRLANNNGDYTYRGFSKHAFKYYDKAYTAEKYANLIPPADSRDYIWVRDDILKTLYPNAKTQKEIKQIYMDKGKYEESDLTDVTIKSPEEFRELLEKIDALGLKEDGRKVWPFYTHSGEDNWDLLTMFGPTLFGKGIADAISCFSYYDGEEDQMKKTLEQDWFRDMVKYFNELVIDGLASKEALIDTKANFDQKKVNGEYAIFYGNMAPPTDQQLAAANKAFSYRKVMLDIPGDYNKYMRFNTRSNCFASYEITFFNSKLNGTQLEQVMRFLDFFYTEAGMKYANWGPKKAGLYEEDENGNMRYTDERFENAMMTNTDTEILVDYGIYSFPRIDYILKPDGVNKYQPELIYANYKDKRTEDDWSKQWNYGYYEALPEFPSVNFTWQVWNFAAHSDGMKRFWNARTATEEALKTIFTATNDAEFDKLYNNMLSVVETNGFDSETLKAMTRIVHEVNGEEISKELKDWKAE